MLQRHNRLHRDKDIKNVLARGRCAYVPAFRLCVLLGPSPFSRAACVCGKSVDKSAVVRHKYQRQLRIVASRLIDSMESGRTYDLVLIARPGIKSSVNQIKLISAAQTQLKKLIK
ncbi:MAG: ribonuclease P protein component [Candidatus Binatia bacterium]|nr:ribonuclease P protein component [Candidatus Binatia bacterium]